MKDAALELTNTEEKTLRAIVLHYAEEPFTCEGLEAAAPGELTGYEAEIGVAGLRRRGIVVTRKKAWGERFHMLSSGMLGPWQQAFLRVSTDDWTIAEELVEPVYEPGRRAASLLFGMLSLARRSGFPLTSKGSLHKRELQRLAERLKLTDREFEGLECTYMHQDKYGKGFAIVYDMALRLGLLRHSPDRAALDQDALRSWLGQPARNMEDRLLALWWDVYTPNDSWLQHAAAMIRALPNGRWTTAERLVEALEASGIPRGGRSAREAADIVHDHWLLPMRALGWLEFGTPSGTEAEGSAFRWNRCAESDEDTEDQGWYVQPDFEIIVAPGVSYALRWELEGAAIYEGGTEVERYRLTKEAWEQGIEAGCSAERLIEALRRGAKYGIPQNVEDTLRQWGSRFGSVALERVTLLRCRDAGHADEIMRNPDASVYILAILGDRDMIVRSGAEEELFRMLDRQGYSPRRVMERDNHDPDIQLEEIPQGIVHALRSAEIFPIDPEPPGPERFRELTANVPQSWIRQFRRYHSSTMKEVIETAVRMRTMVRLGKEGEDQVFYPRSIERYGTSFRAVGYMDGRQVSVNPEEWSEVQLLLPD